MGIPAMNRAHVVAHLKMMLLFILMDREHLTDDMMRRTAGDAVVGLAKETGTLTALNDYMTGELDKQAEKEMNKRKGRNDKEYVKKIMDIAARMRKLAEETGQNISIETTLNDLYPGEAASITWIGPDYRHDHYYGGSEAFSFRRLIISPETIRIGQIPEGLSIENKK